MLSQLEENLLHLEGSRDGLNQDSRTDCSLRHSGIVLRKDKDVIPEASLEIVLHLGEVEVWSVTSLHEFLGVMVEVEGKIEDAS